MAIIVVVIAVIGVVLYKISGNSTGNDTAASSTPVNQSILVHTNSHQTNPGAKVSLVEFGDYQCPACGAAYQPIKALTTQYASNKDFNFVFRNFPLPMHPNAPMAAEAAEAAGAQGKYWEMHDKLYETQNDWADVSNPLSMFVGYAQGLGLNVSQFQSDVEANKYASVISADQADGNSANVNATPTFFVNGVPYVGYSTDVNNAVATALGK